MKNSKQNYKPMLYSTEMVEAILAGRKTQTRRLVNERDTGFLEYAFKNKKNIGDWILRNAKFNIGDIIWVRETFWFNEREQKLHYKADYESSMMLFSGWKPSIHMPKQAARIFLKVLSVKIERLQDISEKNALSEGVEKFNHGYGGSPQGVWFKDYLYGSGFDQETAKKSFMSLWKSINGKDSWNANPFVWVYEFEKIEKPEGWLQTQ